jgi:pilus assembly protein CpaB
MKPKTVILMVVAIGCGLAASIMTSKLLSEQRQGPPAEEKVAVLYTKTRVPRGTAIKEPEKFFEIRQVPKDAAPKTSYLNDFAQLKDKKLNKDLKADVHIAAEDLLDKATTTLDVPPGFGAISLRVTADKYVSGFVYPGDRVNVILTRRGKDASALTILRNILVLAVGPTHIRPEDSSVLQATTVSVALKTDDAQLVSLAETLGDLRLMLCREGESIGGSTRVTTVSDLLHAAGDHGRSASLGQQGSTSEEKLPFGVGLPDLEKARTKAKDDPPPVEVAAVKPDWTITIYAGFDPPVRAHYFKRGEEIVKDEPQSDTPKSGDKGTRTPTTKP